MLCNISGITPDEPVITKDGYLFEKRLIHQFILDNKKHPITNEPLTIDDLLEVKGAKLPKPRPAQATSIPALLSLLQNEWDSAMIEQFTMKQHLDTVRQELAHSLYQHDAACRVVSRLMKERDAARSHLAQFETRVIQAEEAEAREREGEAMSTDAEAGLPQGVLQKISEKSSQLTAKRKKRQISSALADTSSIEKLETSVTAAPHSAGTPGILCISAANAKDNLVLSGGLDGQVVLLQRDGTNAVVKYRLTGHTKPIRRVLLHPEVDQDLAFSTGDDGTTRMWKIGDTSEVKHVLRDHVGAVYGLTLSATRENLVTAGTDSKWMFWDIETGRNLVKVDASTVAPNGFSCAQFHPDGVLIGTGTNNNTVAIWDVKSLNNVAEFSGHTKTITNLSFSENGYYLATSSADGTARIWDLRKLAAAQTLNLGRPVTSVAFDFSGSYLAATSEKSVRLYNKSFEEIKALSDAGENVTDVAWGADAKWLATTAMDRQIRFYEF